MLTFQDIYEEAQEQVQDNSATSLILIKRAINQGAKKFANILNREWRIYEETFDLVAEQQFYQLPEDCVRVKSLRVTIGGVNYTLEECVDELTWNRLNERSSTSSVPELFYIKGNDQIGIYPKPSAAVSDGATLAFERSIRDMAEANYTDGTITVTNGSVVITGASTTFTEKMVGRVLFVTDGTADGMGYKIDSFTSTTIIGLENKYGGSGGAAKTFKIGEVPDIPEEWHESLVDYACFRYYLRRKDRTLARDFSALFNSALERCQDQYSSKTTSQYIAPVGVRSGYVHQPRDYEVT